MNNAMVYVIVDEQGNFVSEFSFSRLDREGRKWSFSSYSGLCEGFRYYPGERYAETIKTQLEAKTKRLGLNKKYSIGRIKYSDIIIEGKYITERIDAA